MGRIDTFLMVAVPVLSQSANQNPRHPIFELARAWAGPGTAFQCRNTDPHGQRLDSADGRYCEWAVTTGGRGTDQLSATLYEGAASAIIWHRSSTSRADAERVVDSLRTALRKRGLEGHRCAFGGKAPAGNVSGEMWDTKNLFVHIGKVVSDTAPPKLLITAGDDPSSFPPVLCQKVVETIG